MRSPVAKKKPAKPTATKKPQAKQAFNASAAKQSRKPPMFPPINEAAMHGKLALVKKLLKQGANIEERDNNDGSTPLILACRYKRPDVALELIARGADVNATERGGGFAMIWAATNDMLEVGRKMLEKGAKPAVRTQNIRGRVSPAFQKMIDDAAEKQARLDAAKRAAEAAREAAKKPLTFEEELKVAAVLQKPLTIMHPLRLSLRIKRTRGLQRA